MASMRVKRVPVAEDRVAVLAWPVSTAGVCFPDRVAGRGDGGHAGLSVGRRKTEFRRQMLG